jgi:hypothetical protein
VKKKKKFGVYKQTKVNEIYKKLKKKNKKHSIGATTLEFGAW